MSIAYDQHVAFPKRRAFRPAHNHHPLLHGFAGVIQARGLSLGQLDRLSGIPAQTIRRWETHCPTVANLDVALQALGFRLVIAPLEESPDAAVIARTVRSAR